MKLVFAAVVLVVRREARAQLKTGNTRREIRRLRSDVGIFELNEVEVRDVAIDTAGTGLGVLSADVHQLLGAVAPAELEPPEVAREEQCSLVDFGHLGVTIKAAGAHFQDDRAAVQDTALGRAVGFDEQLIVHEEGVSLVTLAGDGVLGARLHAKLGGAAEHHLDAADTHWPRFFLFFFPSPLALLPLLALLRLLALPLPGASCTCSSCCASCSSSASSSAACARALSDMESHALTIAVLHNQRLRCMIYFSTRTAPGQFDEVRFRGSSLLIRRRGSRQAEEGSTTAKKGSVVQLGAHGTPNRMSARLWCRCGHANPGYAPHGRVQHDPPADTTSLRPRTDHRRLDHSHRACWLVQRATKLPAPKP